MADQTFPQKTFLVMAHPDDEILWASSVLYKVKGIIHCFEEIPSHPVLSKGRRRSLVELALPNSDSLRLTESEVFNGASWPAPIEASYGLQVKQASRSKGGFSVARYRENFGHLVRELRPRLAGASSVLTHSPWGEYGHEEHVQVFRAVLALRAEFGYAIWIPGYVSDRAFPFMLRNLSGIDLSTRTFPVDVDVTGRVKELYSRNQCWTWFDDYVWPENEFFYEWTGSAPRYQGAVALNFLRLENPGNPSRSHWGRVIRGCKQRVRRLLERRLARSF